MTVAVTLCEKRRQSSSHTQFNSIMEGRKRERKKEQTDGEGKKELDGLDRWMEGE